MSLTDTFNACKVNKLSDHTIDVVSDDFHYRYDFAMRQQTIWFGKGGDAGWKSFGSTPFAQLDREVLELARNKLIDLGGKPPELPPLQQPDPPKGKKLNL